jgi:hypothetical protein
VLARPWPAPGRQDRDLGGRAGQGRPEGLSAKQVAALIVPTSPSGPSARLAATAADAEHVCGDGVRATIAGLYGDAVAQACASSTAAASRPTTPPNSWPSPTRRRPRGRRQPQGRRLYRHCSRVGQGQGPELTHCVSVGGFGVPEWPRPPCPRPGCMPQNRSPRRERSAEPIWAHHQREDDLP